MMERRKYPPSKRHCRRCDTEFTPVWRGPQYYCSAACRNAGPRLMKMAPFTRVYPARECQTCKQSFIPTNARQLYCERSCLYKAQWAQHKADLFMRYQRKSVS